MSQQASDELPYPTSARRLRRQRPCPEPERISAEAAAAKLGISLRSLQQMAARGDIPGGAKFTRVWTFDRKALSSFIKEKELETCENAKRRRDVTGGAIPSGLALKPAGGGSAGLYKQTIQGLRRSAAKRVKSAQSPKRTATPGDRSRN